MSSEARLLGLIGLLAGALPAQAVTAAEAAQLAFVGCEIRREEVRLRPDDVAAAKQRAALRSMPTRVVRFVAKRGGAVAGVAYVDTRRVRTKAQQLLIALDAAGTVQRIEVLAWKEPARYRPKARFYAQFRGKTLDGSLRLRRGIRPITGATMSARATVAAVRTVLAVNERRPVR